MRVGVVQVARLRSPYFPSFFGHAPPERPLAHGLTGMGTPRFSRQSTNRALLKLEASKIVRRVYTTGKDVVCIMEDATVRQAFRVAGEAVMAHFAKFPIHAASLDGILRPSGDDAEDTILTVASAFAEQKAVELYRLKEPGAQIKSPKAVQKTAKLLIANHAQAIMRVAEHLIISKNLSAARIAQLIEKPLDGE
jgi:hypothetical protein